MPHHPHPHHHKWENSLPEENPDFRLLEILLQDKDLARSVLRNWKKSPSEVAEVGTVVLRLFGALLRAFPARFDFISSDTKNKFNDFI